MIPNGDQLYSRKSRSRGGWFVRVLWVIALAALLALACLIIRS